MRFLLNIYWSLVLQIVIIRWHTPPTHVILNELIESIVLTGLTADFQRVAHRNCNILTRIHHVRHRCE